MKMLALQIAIGAILVLGFGWVLRADQNRVKAQVESCHDGDTCRIKVGKGLFFNVRLAGIDTPELGQPPREIGEQAKKLTNTLIKGKEVELLQVDLDRYNRPVVEIFLGDQLINTALVAEGLAEVYRFQKEKKQNLSAYNIAEAAAKKSKRGIWGIKNYQSARQYRQMTRGQKK